MVVHDSKNILVHNLAIFSFENILAEIMIQLTN